MATILIIHDRDVVRALFREALERAGHIVSEVSKGIDGIRHFGEWLPDLVITDIRMPDRDGLEFIAKMRQEFPGVKILAMSARAGGEHDLMVSRMLGADAVLDDFLDGEALLKNVEGLLADKR